MFMSALFTIAKGWKQSKCQSMNKQNVLPTHSGILFSLNNEGNSDTCCYYTDEP